jgi:hypothetical protein
MNEDMMRAHYASMFLRTTAPDGRTGQDALTGIQERGPLATVYFSPENIEAVGEAIRGLVRQQTGDVIGRQSQQELIYVMRSIYLTYSENRTGDVRREVRDLNERVLRYAVPNVISNLSLHKRFLSEVGKNPVPLSHGTSTSKAGTRQLEMFR